MKSHNPYSLKEIKILENHYKKQAKQEIQSLLPSRTWRGIKAKATKLGLANKKKPNWNQKEINILKRYRPRLTIKDLCILLPCRNPTGIWSKCEKLKILNTHSWTIDEIRLLKKYYPSHNVGQLKLLLPDRTWMGITQKARKLGIQGLGVILIQRERMKLLNRNPEFSKKRLKALCKKPTKPERQLMGIIEKNKLPYKYVGDGSFIIERLNPDFININGKKNIIEVFGRTWHDTLVKDWHRTELGRIMVFNSYGYKTLVIWDDEMDDEKTILNNIKRFERGISRRSEGGIKKPVVEAKKPTRDALTP